MKRPRLDPIDNRFLIFEYAHVDDVTRDRHKALSRLTTQLGQARLRFVVEANPCGVFPS
jgi:hypothetical protein